MTAIPYGVVLVLATLSGLTTLIGVGPALTIGRNERGAAAGIGFSTGIMLIISFFELVPEAVTEIGPMNTGAATIGGLLLVATADPLLTHFHIVKEVGVFGQELESAYLIAFGLILHDFPEGFAMANSYVQSPALGILIAVAIGLHNVPEEFAMCLPIVPLENRLLLYKMAFLSGLSEPAGALVGLVAVDFVPGLNPVFMAVAAGAMIYVSIHELVPLAKTFGNVHLFGIGLITSGVVYVILTLLMPGLAV